MARIRRPHVLGIDDGPFDKGQPHAVPVVGVLMEAGDLCEAVALGSFPVDGADATRFLADWIGGLRFLPSVQAVVLGGITIAGLGVVDVEQLSRELELPVLVVTRRDPSQHRLGQALGAAGLEERLDVVGRVPEASRIHDGLWMSFCGTTREAAEQLLDATLNKSSLPEPLRLAHLFARAIVDGESRGRV